MKTYKAIIDHPPSLNRLYGLAVKRVGSKTVPYKYMTKEGKAYLSSTIDRLKYEYAWKKHEKGDYFVLVDIVVSSRNTDIDNVNKVMIDAIKVAIGIDDRYIYALPSVRIPVKSYVDQGVQIMVDVVETNGQEQLARRLGQQKLFHQWLKDNE